jgi:hypothetical protein
LTIADHFRGITDMVNIILFGSFNGSANLPNRRGGSGMDIVSQKKAPVKGLGGGMGVTIPKPKSMFGHFTKLYKTQI